MAGPTKGFNRTETKVRSTHITGPAASDTIPDAHGKSVTKIQGEIKQLTPEQIVSKWKNDSANAKIGLKGFLEKNNLFTVLGISPDFLDKLASEGESLIGYAQQGLQAYQDFKDGNYQALLDQLGGFVGGDLKDLINQAGDIYGYVKDADFHTFAGIMGLTEKILGFNIGDAWGLTKLHHQITNLLNLAQKYGVHDAIAQIRDKFGRVKNGYVALGKGFKMNALHAQIETMDRMLDIMDGASVLALNPNIIEMILTHYRFPLSYNKTSEDLVKYREQLVRVLSRIDPYWDKEVIDGETYMKLAPWRTASEHAKALFRELPAYRSCIECAPLYPKITLRQGLNYTYPYLKL